MPSTSRRRRRAGARPDARDIHTIRTGFPWRQVDEFRGRFGFTDAELAHLLGISERTLTRVRRLRRPLDPVAGDRFYRLRRIVRLAAAVLEDDEGARAMSWLKRPQRALGGAKPVDLLDTHPGAEAVERLLLQLEHGVLP